MKLDGRLLLTPAWTSHQPKYPAAQRVVRQWPQNLTALSLVRLVRAPAQPGNRSLARALPLEHCDAVIHSGGSLPRPAPFSSSIQAVSVLLASDQVPWAVPCLTSLSSGLFLQKQPQAGMGQTSVANSARAGGSTAPDAATSTHHTREPAILLP